MAPMIRSLALFAALCLTLAGCGQPAPADAPAANDTVTAAKASLPPPPVPAPDRARVRLETSAGAIMLELDGRRAPVTTANFLAYVDQRRFDGTSFYRAARTPGAQSRGFIQGGIRHTARRALPQIAHEPTSRTGLRHVDGTISMARNAPGSAMGDFFITLGAMPAMDANPRRAGDNQGFAAFGRVVEGMDVARRILAAPTVPNAGRGAMRGQMITAPVRIVSARRAP
jgi:peptidyl-prolyl cis-trans isomerase A (cyclophilin A)